MSVFSSETNPQILVNGEHQEQQKEDDAAGEEQISSVIVDEQYVEDGDAEEMEKQAKIQTVFQQVRERIRSQVGMKAQKSSIMELVQRVRDRETEMAQVNNEPEGRDVGSEEKKQLETETDESKTEMNLKEEELFVIFEDKLETSQKALREEFDAQICQVRKEMQAYTDKALKDLESKLQRHNQQETNPKEQQESRGPDRKLRASAAPSLTSKRGRVLTRTMTTIIPKTCAPVIIGPRAKSETLSSSKADSSSRLVLRDPLITKPGNKPGQSRRPLPPTCPPLHQRKKTLPAKAKTGK